MRGRWSVVVGSLLGLAAGSGAVMAFTFSLFVAPLAEAFEWSRTTISLGFSAMTLTLALAAPLAGRVLDRFGVRRTLLVGIPLFALSISALSLMPGSIAVYLVLFALAGVIGAGQTPIGYVKVISQWFDDRRGLALGIAMTGTGVGGLILAQGVRVLLEQGGWRVGFAGLGAAILLIGWPAVWLLLHEPEPAAGPTPAFRGGAEVPGATRAEALRDFNFWAILIFVFFLTVAVNGAAGHAVPLLISHGLTSGKAAALLVAMALSSLIGRLVTGYVLDRAFAPRVAALVCLVALVGIGLLWSGASVASAVVGLACLGFSLGAETDVMSYLLGRYFGLRSFGELAGYTFGMLSLASAVGVPLMGMSFDFTGSYGTALVGVALGLLVATAVILRLGPYTFRATTH